MIRLLFLVTGLFAIALGLVLTFRPELYLSLYVEAHRVDMDFAARRFGPVVVGLGALLLVAREATDTVFLARLCRITSAVWIGVAATGLYAYASGTATSAIVVAAMIEGIAALLFVYSARQMPPEV